MVVPQDIWNTVIGILLVVLLMLFLKKTRIGKAMRATAQDREAARLMGVNVRQCMSLTFVLSSAIGDSSVPQIFRDCLSGTHIWQ